jgi:GTP-binding protein HflX
LFATLDTKVRAWRLRDRRRVLLADTVGFVRDLPHHLIASFHATLEETLNADLLLHVADAADPQLDSHLRAVETVLNDLGAAEIPRLLLLNKADRLDPAERLLVRAQFPDALFVSAATGEGLEALDAAVSARLDAWSLRLDLVIPATAGRVLAELRTVGRIESERWDDERWVASLVLPTRPWQQLRPEIEACGGTWSAAAAPAVAD